MNPSRIVPAVIVAGLAVAAALMTTNVIRAAENAASVAVRQTMRAASAGADISFVTGGGPDLATSFPGFARELGLVYHSSGLLFFTNHALHEIGTVTTDAQAATETARHEADLNALFAVAVRVKPARVEAAKNAQGEKGKRVYLDLCYACHQTDGQGLPGTFPMLAKSDYMAADRTRAIRIVLEGLAGPVTVNGETINSVMPAQKRVLTDEQVADVLTYAFNSWENPGGAFTAGQVAAIRNEKSRD